MKTIFRRIINIFLSRLSFLEKAADHPKIIVLCYHGFSGEKWRFNVRVKEFKKQMILLMKSYKFITARELEDFLNGKKVISENSVLLTIDDGYADIMDIKNFLNSYNIKPLVFLLSSNEKLNRKELDNKKKTLSSSDVKKLILDGWTIGSHGATHSDFYSLNTSEIYSEVVGSKLVLEKLYLQPIKYFAFPKGRYSTNILEMVKDAGYSLSFTMDDGIIKKGISRFTIPRIGVDGTHSMGEFPTIYTNNVIKFRQIVKKYIPSLAAI